MVPEVGGSAIGEVRASIDAMKDMAERVILSGAETIVLISPHAPLDARAFVAYHGDRLYGNFARFNAADAIVDASLDKDLLSAITRSARDRGLKVLRIFNNQLDHGIAVPLYFLQRNGWHGKVVCLG